MSCRPDPSTESKCEGCSLNEIFFFFAFLSLSLFVWQRLTQQCFLLVEGAAADAHLLVKRVQELLGWWGEGTQPGEFRQRPVLAKTLQCFDGQESRRSTNLVLLGGRVMFADPGGSCGPLSE